MARILIAEDDDAVRGLVVRALSEDGHDVTATADGAEALDALDRAQRRLRSAAHRHQDAGDGRHRAGARRRRATIPDVAILLMTGYADQRERAHGLDALIHDVIAKPFSVEQIKGAVREALVQRH